VAKCQWQVTLRMDTWVGRVQTCWFCCQHARSLEKLFFPLFFQNPGGQKFTVAVFHLFFILFFVCFYCKNFWVGSKNSRKTAEKCYYEHPHWAPTPATEINGSQDTWSMQKTSALMARRMVFISNDWAAFKTDHSEQLILLPYITCGLTY